MGSQEAGLQLNRFSKKAGAFGETLLLESNGAEYGVGAGACLRSGEGQPRLLVCLLEPPLLKQGDRFLQGLARVRTGNGTQALNATEQQRADEAGSPTRRSTMLSAW